MQPCQAEGRGVECAPLMARQRSQEQQDPNWSQSAVQGPSHPRPPHKKGRHGTSLSHSERQPHGHEALLIQKSSACQRWAADGCRVQLWAALTAAACLSLLCWGAMQLASGGQLAPLRWAGRSSASAAAAAAAAGGRPAAQCSPPELDGSPWETHCQRLRNVCVDQGNLIFYDSQYQELDHRTAGKLPQLLVDTSKIYEYPWRMTPSSDHAADSSTEGGSKSGSGDQPRRKAYEVQIPTKNRRIPPVPTRPATSAEPRPYLQDPVFSNCTIPLLLYPGWRFNFFHVYRDLGSHLHSLLRRTPWRQHAKLVVVTPEGLPLSSPEAQLLAPLSAMSVQSMADFSSRLPAGYQPGQEWGEQQAPASYEGGEQRCFRNLLFCGRNIHTGMGRPAAQEAAASAEENAAALTKEVPFEVFEFGQTVARYVQQQTKSRKEQQQGLAAAGGGGGSSQAALALPLPEVGSSATAVGDRSTAQGRLKVVVMKRDSVGRQLLNSRELVERCNAWQYRPPGSQAVVSADCQELSFPDLASGVAAAQEADVFIGMHGANLANGWMMRPGSSVIEIIPYQFETGRGTFAFSIGTGMDTTSQVLWWVAVICDPAASTPGPNELAGLPLEEWWPRDRNAVVPWSALEEVLQEVVAAGGSRERYVEQYWGSRQYRFNLNATGVMSRGGMLCPPLSPPLQQQKP